VLTATRTSNMSVTSSAANSWKVSTPVFHRDPGQDGKTYDAVR